MNKIKELFGLNCKALGAELSLVLKKQLCPFTGGKCIKTRKSQPGVAIGTCTVEYQNQDVIICPFRLIEKRQIFMDCIHLLTLHEPGNQLYVIPEVAIPGGNVDYFLVSAKDGKVMDFVGIELQTMDTTGTVWPERQRLLEEHGIRTFKRDVQNTRPFGMNWKMTAKTILVQLHHKARTFENLHRHLVLIIQSPFLDYMKSQFSFDHVKDVRMGDVVHIHAYALEDKGDRFCLSLSRRLSTDVAGIAKCLGLQAAANVAFEEIAAILESKLKDEYRLAIGESRHHAL